MNWIIVLKVVIIIAFIVQMICFPATINDNAKRAYGRLFGTRVDTVAYNNIFYISALLVIVCCFLKNCIVG